MLKNNEERSFINLMRGIAIFLMLWGHSIQYCCGQQFDFFENWAFKIIYTFHMPLFMVISGYLFFFSAQKRNFEELILYRTKSLLYPILMCSILNFILTTSVPSLIYGVYSDIIGSPSLMMLWFLWSVLSASFAVSIAVKITDNVIIQTILLIIGILIVPYFPCSTENIFMYPYFVLGYLYARNRMRINRFIYNLIGIISILSFLIMLFNYEKEHYIYTSGLFGGNTLLDSIKIDFFRWGIGIFGSVAIIWICRHVKNLRICKCIEYMGKNSLAMYALSVSLLSYYLPLVSNKILEFMPWVDWNKNIAVYNLLITPGIAIIYCFALSHIIKILKKIKLYKIVFGR